MIDGPIKERRICPRHGLAVGVRFSHAMSKRDFPGRCVNLSTSGLLMYVPAGAPVKPGHQVHLTLGQVPQPALAGLSDTRIEGTIVRVDRSVLLTQGRLAVAVRFAI